jgi:pimeloyl-ACP methyl ester carboxylesterase
MQERHEVRYARSGDADIAYTVFGPGPEELVDIPGFISHQDLIQDTPYGQAWRRALSAAGGRVVTFDKRGTGLSERSLGLGSVAERMDDIRAVMDAAEMERASLVGRSEGGPLAILFAATYPDRVKRLVLSGTFARGVRSDDYPLGMNRERLAQAFTWMRENWGTGEVMKLFIQNTPDDVIEQLARYERASCTPHMIEEIMWRNVEMDVRDALGAIAVPTLVLHRKGDPVVPVRLGRYLAENIPGARYVELEGNVHGDWRSTVLIEHIGGFVFGNAPEPEPEIDRVLATVLFTDIVASTERTAAVGDRRWTETLDEHDRIARGEVERYKGRLIKTTGDGVLATFDGPARSIACAKAISKAVGQLGIDIRAGLHTGEVELRGEDISGIGVVIARRICDLAGDGELLASRTVKDLVTGSGITFDEKGSHSLKGVPDDWQLFAVDR